MRRAAVLLFALCAIGCGRLDYNPETYVTGKMARDFGAFQRGLAPAFVPDDARDVTLAHNHVTGAAWMRCELPEAAAAKISATVNRVRWAEARSDAEAAPCWLGDWHPVLSQQPLRYTPDASSVYFIDRETSGEWHGIITAAHMCYAYRLPSARKAPSR